METKLFLCDIDLSCVDLSFLNLGRANLQGANLEEANLEEANLEGANLEGANLPSPASILACQWGEIENKELCRDLMNYDAANHPNPSLFVEWANGDQCPYSGVQVDRACFFIEQKELLDLSVPLCRPYDLMMRLFEEKKIQR